MGASNGTVVEESNSEELESTVTSAPDIENPETTPAPLPKENKVLSPGSCALPIVPYGEREDSTGYRFGIEKGSRLEFDRTSSVLDQNLVFSVQVHAAATNGFILFLSDEKQTEFVTLYLNQGFVNFMFGQPNNYVSSLICVNQDFITYILDPSGQ